MELVQWVDSFMSHRTARVRLQDTTAESISLKCGVPQGSPISPILFLLYIQPIYSLGIREQRFGYADDVAMLQIGSSIADTAKAATEDVSTLVKWGQENAIYFEP